MFFRFRTSPDGGPGQARRHFFCKKSSKKFEKIWRFGFFAYLCVRVQGKRIKTEQDGAVVQLVRIPACHAGGRGVESRPHRKRTSSFESREHSSVGSERLPYKQRVGGSTPSAPTKETPLQIAVRAFFFSLPYHTREDHLQKSESPPEIEHLGNGRTHKINFHTLLFLKNCPHNTHENYCLQPTTKVHRTILLFAHDL